MEIHATGTAMWNWINKIAQSLYLRIVHCSHWSIELRRTYQNLTEGGRKMRCVQCPSAVYTSHINLGWNQNRHTHTYTIRCVTRLQGIMEMSKRKIWISLTLRSDDF